jgi:predicted ArsR family transcriptional regulator
MSQPQSPAAEGLSALASLDDPLRRRLYDFVCGACEPVSRDQAAVHAGIGRTLAAYHLDRLVEVGLLTADFRRPEGRSGPGAGRPAKLYARAEREYSVSLPPRDYELLARLLVEAVEHDGTGAVRTALGEVAERAGRQAAETALSATEGTAENAGTLTSALRTCGYEPATTAGGDIQLGNCPFHRVAQAHTDTVCGLNLRLLEGLVDAIEPRAGRAALEPEAGRCCVVIHAV